MTVDNDRLSKCRNCHCSLRLWRSSNVNEVDHSVSTICDSRTGLTTPVGWQKIREKTDKAGSNIIFCEDIADLFANNILVFFVFRQRWLALVRRSRAVFDHNCNITVAEVSEAVPIKAWQIRRSGRLVFKLFLTCLPWIVCAHLTVVFGSFSAQLCPWTSRGLVASASILSSIASRFLWFLLSSIRVKWCYLEN